MTAGQISPESAAGPGAVQLIGHTVFTPPAGIDFDTDAEAGQALVEFAGRAIYRSWDKPIPATASNAGFLRHLIEVGHLSVLEHASATFLLQGIPRSVSHELLRHRHFSFSELSPRQPVSGAALPAALRADPELAELADTAVRRSEDSYREVLKALEAKASGAVQHKQARQAARALLPMSQPTDLVMTGNLRSWRHFVGMRATDPADVELRELAVEVLRQLQALAPNVFADFRISELADGSTLAASPHVRDA